MSNFQKVVRAVIILGDIELDVFQMPDGSYQISQSQTTNVVNKPPKRMVELAQSERGQILIQSGFEKGLKVQVEGSKPVNLVPLEVAFQFWVLELAIGNQAALGLVVACGVEALERRADAAFGIIRTEEERNQRFITRRDGILSRHFWTDTIDEYIKTHEVSDNYKRFIYINASDAVNKAVLGMSAKQFRESLSLPDGISTRDYCTTEQLKQIDTIEKAAGMRVKRDDLCPKQALKDVISMIC